MCFIIKRENGSKKFWCFAGLPDWQKVSLPRHTFLFPCVKWLILLLSCYSFFRCNHPRFPSNIYFRGKCFLNCIQKKLSTKRYFSRKNSGIKFYYHVSNNFFCKFIETNFAFKSNYFCSLVSCSRPRFEHLDLLVLFDHRIDHLGQCFSTVTFGSPKLVLY